MGLNVRLPDERRNGEHLRRVDLVRSSLTKGKPERFSDTSIYLQQIMLYTHSVVFGKAE